MTLRRGVVERSSKTSAALVAAIAASRPTSGSVGSLTPQKTVAAQAATGQCDQGHPPQPDQPRNDDVGRLFPARDGGGIHLKEG